MGPRVFSSSASPSLTRLQVTIYGTRVTCPSHKWSPERLPPTGRSAGSHRLLEPAPHTASILSKENAPLKDTRLDPALIRRRRTLGFAYLVLAVFCGVVAAAPWPGKVAFDFAMWLCFAAILLIIGAWQIDKASREETDLPASRPS